MSSQQDALLIPFEMKIHMYKNNKEENAERVREANNQLVIIFCKD